MEPLFWLILTPLVAAPAILWQWHRNQALAETWRMASSEQGLGLDHVVSVAGVSSVSLDGRSGDFVLTLGRWSANRSRQRTVMQVSNPLHLDRHMALRRETLGSRLNQLMGEKDIPVGDRAFDDAVAVYGQREQLVAVLDTPTRAAEALGQVGTAASVATLHAAAAADPLDLRLRRAVVGAVAAIQSRLTGAAPGQLALAGGDTGTLALADPTTGGVSLVESLSARPPG